MNSKTYYGEYTLKHWITLILSKNIKLPEYQRSFVWSEKSVLKLIDSLKNGQFIPPVTIAHYQSHNSSMNLILDGQQRLTSILLAYLGFFPDKSKFSLLDTIATSDDSNEVEIDDDKRDDNKQHRLNWTYENLLKKENRIESPQQIINQLIADGKYHQLAIHI